MKFFKNWLVQCFLVIFVLGMATVVNAKDVSGSIFNAPDYSLDTSWSIVTKKPVKAFDVFYVHPTTYGAAELGLNAPIDNKDICGLTDATVLSQVSVFKNECNIYAPRYRQVSIEVLGMNAEEGEPYLMVAENDTVAAFRYYLKHYNNGRPYILASHSQGSDVSLRFLKKYRDLVSNDQLVAAYLIGWTFTDEDLKQIDLPLALTPEQTGALITWNTVGKGGKSPTLLPGANCVNPLTWTVTADYESASLNHGAVIELNDGTVAEINNFTSARINEAGGLQIPTPTIVDKLNMRMGKEIYHRYDYAFFYNNIVENVSVRCNAWKNRK